MKLSEVGKSLGFPIFITFIFLPGILIGQALEVGVGLGGTTYTGDLVRGYDITLNRPAGMGFVRYNLSNIVSLRAAGMGGFLRADERDNPIDPVSQARGASFDRIVLEGSLTLEYHFLDYKQRNSLINWSPYFFGGIGLSAYTNKNSDNNYSRIQPVIPFGVGMKYILDRRWSLGFEFGARKTFFDYIDEVSAPEANPNDNDWYYFTGFTLSYTFYTIPCPYHGY